MNAYHLKPTRSGSGHSRPTPTSPSAAKKSAPAKTLLVVDDEAMVRDLEVQILRQEGYAVLEAQGPAEALRLARETAVIDLLITDFSIPEVDGIELSRRFRLVHPKTPVLMVSGSFQLMQKSAHDLDGIELLTKPFEIDELLHRVRCILDATVPPYR